MFNCSVLFFWIIFSEFPCSEFKYETLMKVQCFMLSQKKKLYCLLCSLIASYITIFFVIIFFLPLLQDSATTWENTNLKINFINLFIWFIRLSVKFLNNIWHIQNAHEFHIKICFINIVYCIFCICSWMYRVSLF